MTVNLIPPIKLNLRAQAELKINLNMIAENLALLRKKAQGLRLMAIVKANGYGTDSVRLSSELAKLGIDIFGVAFPSEAIFLRECGVTQDIFVIHADPKDAPSLIEYDLEVGLCREALIDSLEKEAKQVKKRAKIHIHVNTGMNRLGCRSEEALIFAKRIARSPYLELEGLMTHFTSADDPLHDPFTHQQIRKIETLLIEMKEAGIEPKWCHGANSSAFLRFKAPCFNMARIGLALFGCYNTPDCKGILPLKPALSLTSQVIEVHTCSIGESVSYNRDYIVKQEGEKIAVIPLGYHDGIGRNFSGKGYVLIRGYKAPLVGKICMDFMMADVTEIPNIQIGDPVLFFGEDEWGSLDAETFANFGNVITHELFARLGSRIARHFY